MPCLRLQRPCWLRRYWRSEPLVRHACTQLQGGRRRPRRWLRRVRCRTRRVAIAGTGWQLQALQDSPGGNCRRCSRRKRPPAAVKAAAFVHVSGAALLLAQLAAVPHEHHHG